VVDVNIEQQSEIPMLTLQAKHTELAFIGLSPGELVRSTRAALQGVSVGQYWYGERPYDVVLKLPQSYRQSAASVHRVPIAGAGTGGRRWAELEQVASIQRTLGPNLINHENGQRRILVTANVAGRDLVGTARDVQSRLDRELRRPSGYSLELGGQFETEARTSQRLLVLSAFVLLAMVGLLTLAFRSLRDALIVLVNLPLALIGGVVAVALGGGVLTIAAMVGFITLFGIATRNGILMVSHIKALRAEGMPPREAVINGSKDRLVPILMTALTAALALIPIALATGEPGSEIQGPMAAIILGGLVSSTLLNLCVVPALYWRFGKDAS
jgi:Cu/Ag efflux pump CusA